MNTYQYYPSVLLVCMYDAQLLNIYIYPCLIWCWGYNWFCTRKVGFHVFCFIVAVWLLFILSVNFISYYFMFGIHPCAARSLRQRLFVKQSYLLVLEKSRQWNEMPMKERRNEIYVLVRNLRSTAYRLALATIILEQ